MHTREDNPAPVVSVLCISNRPLFWPWLAWNYNRQRYAKTELVLVYEAGPDVPRPMEANFRLTEHGTGFYPVEPGLSRGVMRQRALDRATGDIIVWFDDDDWQHPERIQWTVDALREGADWFGASTGFFVELKKDRQLRAARYSYPARVPRAVAITLGTWTAFARSVQFDSDARYEDTVWADKVTRDRYGIVDMARTHQFWLQHPMSSNDRRDLPWRAETYDELRASIGVEWGSTENEIFELRSRLGLL